VNKHLAKAKELVEAAQYADDSVSSHMRQDAAIHASIAQAEMLEHIAGALGKLAGKNGILYIASTSDM